MSIKEAVKSHDKAVKQLNRRLNRTLELPRRTEHEWELSSRPNQLPDWTSFYKGRLGQVALTTIDEHCVLGQLRWPLAEASFTSPPSFRPTASFRLVGFRTSPEEMAEHLYDFPGFIGIGEAFDNVTEFNTLVNQYTLQPGEMPDTPTL